MGSQFGDAFDQFLGGVGRTAQAGQLDPYNLPNFSDFARQLDPARLFYQSPSGQRGAGGQAFNPRTRFLFRF